MKFDVTKIEVKDLSGKLIAIGNLNEAIANFIHEKTPLLEWSILNHSLYKDGVMDINEQQKEYLLQLIKHDGCPFSIATKEGIINYLSTLK